jgi:hypothetical protein
MNSDASQGFPKIPLVLGVSGHRMLRQGEKDQIRLQDLVRSIFNEFRRRYPQTPAILLSPLAKGADRLAAQVALESEYRQWCTLVVPMPFPEAQYRQDFKLDGSEEEFDQLLEAAGISAGAISGRLFHMPVPAGADLRQPAARDRQYALVGEFVAHYSQVLIALWDGKISTNPNACGTGAIVNFKLRAGVYPELSRLAGEPWLPPVRPLDVPQTGPVYHIRAPRPSETIPPEDIHLVKLFHQPSDAASDAKLMKKQDAFFQTIFKQFDSFNKGLAGCPQKPAREQLLPEEDLRLLSPELRALNTFHAVASAQSLSNQSRARALLLTTCVLAFLAVVVGGLRSQRLPRSDFLSDWLLFYVVFLVASVGCWALSFRFKWQDKYQDYRALAEGLRVQFFWRLAGLKSSVSDYYLSKQKSELEWVRRAINNCELVSRLAEPDHHSPPSGQSAAARSQKAQELVRRHWVENQAAFFDSVLQREEAELISLKNLGEGLVLFALATVTVFFGSSSHSVPAGANKQMLPLVLAAIPTLAAMLLVVFKEWKKCRQEGLGMKKFAMDLWKTACGVMTGLVFCGLLFNLPRLWPRAFDQWDAPPSWASDLILVSSLFVLADAVLQIKAHLNRWRTLLRENRFLLVEQIAVHCWHGILAAVFLVSLIWLHPIPIEPVPAASTPNAVKTTSARTTHETGDILITVVTLTLALGGLLQYYAEKRALDAHLRENGRMKDLFARASAKLSQRVFQPGDPDDPVKELGQEALLENSTWLLTHRERPLEMPKAS